MNKMNENFLTDVFSPFLSSVGELVADLKRRDIAEIDSDLLRLKSKNLKESLADFNKKARQETSRKKSEIQQDLINRGLSGSTVLPTMLAGAERDAADIIDRATREYNRAIEEIALLEKRVVLQSQSGVKHFLKALFHSRCITELWGIACENRRMSVLSLILVGLPALVGYITMLQTVLKWFAGKD